jgi:spore germination cell wall hydrolase CwlJ-like protein
VLNRAASGKYPTTICGVVEQPWQFSFVNRTGRIPAANRSSEAWRKAVAVARIAQDGVTDQLTSDVLWYHADYVAPSWGRRLNRTTKIGLHIFYR